MTIVDLYPDLSALPLLPFAIAVGLAAMVVAVIRAELHRREARAWSAGAKYLAIAAPPEVDPAGAATLWRHLAAMQRGRWRRFWRGQPYVIFEYAFTGPSLAVRIWVPGGISVPMVIQAINSAWPGATCTVTDAEPPLQEGE